MADLRCLYVSGRNQPGWAGRIYVASSPESTLAGWGDAAATGEDLGTTATFDLGDAPAGSAVLVWITHLPDSGVLRIGNVQVFGS